MHSGKLFISGKQRFSVWLMHTILIVPKNGKGAPRQPVRVR